MKQNMSSTDRLVRLVIAIAIGVLYFTNIIGGVGGIIMIVLACVLLATSVMGFCPVYSLLHISTKHEAKAGG